MAKLNIKALNQLGIKNNNALNIFWFGNSLLIHSVVELLETSYGSMLNLEQVNAELVSGQSYFIHEGILNDQIKNSFKLDFDIKHYGNNPNEIAENLSSKLFAGLV